MSLKAPTPPTPPTIDKGDMQSSTPRIDAHQFFEVPEMPFREKKSQDIEDAPKVDEKNIPAEKQEVSTEYMARDAVAKGAGTLTKRTVTRADDEPPQQNSTPIQNVAPVAPVENISSDRYERGQAVLQEFRDEDNKITETPAPTPTNINQSESHGGIFWMATLIFVIAATFLVAKKFLFRNKPKLRKSDLFESSSKKLKSMSKSPPKPAEKKPTIKPSRLPKKDDDDKGKLFEVRI